MKRSATSTPSKTKKSKVAVAKRSYKRFYPVPRPLGQYSSGFPKQLAMTHRYSQNVQYTHVGPNANSQYANFGTNCLFDPWLTYGGHQPLYFDQVAAIYQHYTVMKARMKVTIVPNTVDAYVSGILIDDDLTPAITTLDGMVEQPSAVLRPLSGTLRWSLSTRIGMLRVLSRPTRWLIPIYKVMRQRILWRLKPSLSSIDLSIKQ